jgi:hypothetical protein
MVGREQPNRVLDQLRRRVVPAHSKVAKDRRQHIDADPAVFRIEHHARDAVPPKASGERSHPLGWVSQVVQDADAYNQVEVEP